MFRRTSAEHRKQEPLSLQGRTLANHGMGCGIELCEAVSFALFVQMCSMSETLPKIHSPSKWACMV